MPIYCRSKEVAERVKYSTEKWSTCIKAFGSHELQLDVLQAAHYCTHSCSMDDKQRNEALRVVERCR